MLDAVREELKMQRDLREADRKEFHEEIAQWRTKSAECDIKLAAEIKTREEEKLILYDVQKELIVAISEVARLTQRANSEDERARASSSSTSALQPFGVHP